MQKGIEERLDACLIFYRNKARGAESEDKRIYHEAYVAGIKRAISEIKKYEQQEEARKK